MGGFVYRQGCRNPYSKIPASFKGRLSDVRTRRSNPSTPSRALVQPLREKYFASPFARRSITDSSCPASLEEGRIAIVTNVECGMRWTRAVLLTRAPTCGRRSRVVLTPRRWRQVRGGIRGRRWQESPVTGESTKETVKTIARECRTISGVTVVTTLVCFVFYCTRGCGASCARHSLRPLRAKGPCTTRVNRAAGMRGRVCKRRRCLTIESGKFARRSSSLTLPLQGRVKAPLTATDSPAANSTRPRQTRACWPADRRFRSRV